MVEQHAIALSKIIIPVASQQPGRQLVSHQEWALAPAAKNCAMLSKCCGSPRAKLGLTPRCTLPLSGALAMSFVLTALRCVQHCSCLSYSSSHIAHAWCCKGATATYPVQIAFVSAGNPVFGIHFPPHRVDVAEVTKRQEKSSSRRMRAAEAAMSSRQVICIHLLRCNVHVAHCASMLAFCKGAICLFKACKRRQGERRDSERGIP